MPNPRRLRGYSLSTILLSTLLAVSLLLHVAVASVRLPAGPQFGDAIPGKTVEAEGSVLRVAVWNIRRGKGLDGQRDLDRIAAGLVGYDFVGLNEVGGAFPPLEDQAAQLGQALDMGWQFTPSQRRWYIDYFGNAFLSRIDPVSWQSVPIIHDLERGTRHRHLQTVQLPWQDGELAIIIFHAERGPIRDRQIRRAIDEFERFKPAILMGDFNADGESALITELLNDGETNTAVNQPEMIDWIFARGVKISDSGYVPAGASDHPLVWAEISAATD